MAAANPRSLTVLDNQGRSPLHIAIQSGQVDIALFLAEVDRNALKLRNNSGYLPLHLACLGGKCNLVNYILERGVYGTSSRNVDGKLPIQLLMFDADCDRDSLEYVQAVVVCSVHIHKPWFILVTLTNLAAKESVCDGIRVLTYHGLICYRKSRIAMDLCL